MQAAEAKLLLQTYERNPILFVGGEGVHLIDDKGDRYLDLLSGIGVNALGYGHPAIDKAIAEQSKKLLHTSNLFFHPGQAELAVRLTEMTGMDRVFFSNSGTEAWEAALKLARATPESVAAKGARSAQSSSRSKTAFTAAPWVRSRQPKRRSTANPSARSMPGVEFVRVQRRRGSTAKFSDESAPYAWKPSRAKADPPRLAGVL